MIVTTISDEFAGGTETTTFPFGLLPLLLFWIGSEEVDVAVAPTVTEVVVPVIFPTHV